ncbi:MAG: hypothetical protein DDT29_02231 [Dehalococcoidia bacterium]|nr:hypothetical protein [Bacillota bacterium]
MEPRVFYKGHRRSEAGNQEVMVCYEPDAGRIPLLPDRSQNIRNHSPNGFDWGYLGSGPAQLALALLLDVTDDEKISLRHYQDFKLIIVANWGDDWMITPKEILGWLDILEPQVLEESLCPKPQPKGQGRK